ncbi:MAG: type II toxin-antitoxin system VapC family toxin [Defluviitaleaceae bacterium]|nr:type II toxin-antitoxin system VapC family toxin [Defluviitaleaceae bacterium]
MKLLLDTHTALWWVNEYKKLSPSAKNMLLDDTNKLYISIVSLWEIAIKVSLGKMQGLTGGVGIFIAKMKYMPISLLPVLTSHVEIVETLPYIHRDPFDRLLVATAITEGLTILTVDESIHSYDTPTVW